MTTLFKPVIFTWWQVGLLKLSLLSLGFGGLSDGKRFSRRT